jgi:hypothetical protein
MAAQHRDIPIPAKTWVQLNDGDITSAMTIQSRYPYDILLKPGTTTTLPSNQAGAFLYRPGAGELRSIASLCPGVSGADNIFAWCSEATIVTVSHAAS